jgi:alpha-galactosidase
MQIPSLKSRLTLRSADVLYGVAFTLLLGLGTLSAFAQNDLSGYWNLRVPNGDGTYRETFFQLQQSGESLTGKWFGRDPSGIPIEGTIKEAVVHFATVPPPAPAGAPAGGFGRRPVVYDGTFQDGKMTLTSQGFRGQTMKGDAERTTREAAMPPAPLPLPALKDVSDNNLVRTPPMGWNSWNKFAGKITDQDIRTMADAMVASGMSKLGYVYINIDDTWEDGRDKDGNILTNTKFPDMKALADYVHSKGLKIGIYSSPGPKTCAGYTGSFGHEAQDAKMFAAWGIDYLKYDLCSARNIYPSTEASHRGLYQKMGAALQATGRPIVFSLCQYGENDPWKWGTRVGGNLWRTTGDIRDAWSSMDTIGFSQVDIASYTRPGHWNDPDMLEIGNGGMNNDEYRTHMSLWSMLSAPLIAGNDLRDMSDETKSILMNAEVIAVDQDSAALPTRRLSKDANIEILLRKMKDGSVVIGIFNRGEQSTSAGFALSSIDPAFSRNSIRIRDLWKHENVSATEGRFESLVPRHGVVMLRVSQ